MILDYTKTIVPESYTMQKKLETWLDIFSNGNKVLSFGYGLWI